MFQFFKKKEVPVIKAPVNGKAVPLSEVSDPTFGEGILGKGAAVIPSDGKICAPADGEIVLLFDTLHAVSLKTDNGAEILVHIGLDTVALKGDGFTAHVKNGDKVHAGDLLITADLEKIKAAGYDTITPVIVCNTDEFADVEPSVGKEVSVGDTLITLKK